ncbi:hypothetical protein [Nocardioides speluncae]|uniref:hypothetical protein n=1 Tax=Nocardioides speluncae TaxID=2670337 RepID=UPI0012B17D7E|nr:hypothetical protein [Nocardioides speluncae]
MLAFVLGLAWAPTTADAARALQGVIVKNSAANPVKAKLVQPATVKGRVTARTGRVGVVLRTPSSAEQVTPGNSKFYSFSTRSLESIRITANGASGTQSCDILISINGVQVRGWTIGQFQNISEVFESPGTRMNIAVNSPNNCWIFLGAVGTRLG